MGDLTDRELLELAANAAGFELREFFGGKFHAVIDGKGRLWNPLTDDCDRYRLARTLKLTIDFETGSITGPSFNCDGQTHQQVFFMDDPESIDRNIVHTAAEIGKEMK